MPIPTGSATSAAMYIPMKKYPIQLQQFTFTIAHRGGHMIVVDQYLLTLIVLRPDQLRTTCYVPFTLPPAIDQGGGSVDYFLSSSYHLRHLPHHIHHLSIVHPCNIILLNFWS